MTSDDEHVGDGPAPGGDPSSPPNPSDPSPPGNDPNQGGAPPSAPGGQAPPPAGAPPTNTGGHAPPPSGGGGPPGRQLSIKRIVAVLAVVGLIIGGIAVFALGMGPSIPSIGGCNADVANVTFATHQSSGADGERVAVQLTHIENANHVLVMNGDTEVANMTGVGNTTTVTGLSNGDTLKYVGDTKCGQHVVGTYPVE